MDPVQRSSIAYQVALELTTADGVVSSYSSTAPGGRGHLGAGYLVRLPPG